MSRDEPVVSRTPDGLVRVALARQERRFLVGLLGELVDLVVDDEGGAAGGDPLAAMVGIGTATHLPLDPVLARLLPDAYPGDAMASGDFRRYTEAHLRERKVAHARAVAASLDADGPVLLDEAGVAAWLGSLNDLRLVLGTALGVEEDDDPAERLAGPDADAYLVYDWLTGLQSVLLDAL